MSEVIVAERYAKAYLNTNKDNNSELRKDIETLEYVNSLFEIEDAKKILKSPVMPSDLKLKLLQFASEKAGTNQRIEGLIASVVEAKRVTLFPKIVSTIIAKLDEREGIINADLVSAVELNEDELAKLKTSLEQVTGKTIKLRSKVDQSILGGFIVRMGHHLLDLSVKTKLDELTETAAV